MKKIILLTMLNFLLLSGCSVDESDNNPDWSPGLYIGAITPIGAATEPSLIMITSDKRALFAELDVESSGLGLASGSVVTLGTQATMTLTDNLSGSYNFAATSGTFSFSATELYNIGSSSDTLDGTYIDENEYSGIGVLTWVFTNGAFSFTGALGCSGDGDIVPIDTTKNEYDVSLTVSSCGAFDGEYTGLAFTDQTFFENDTIHILVQNAAGNALIYSETVKQ